MKFVLGLLLSYLIGAIPFSFIITKLKTGKDLRKVGDGNVGAQNTGRIAGPLYGVLAAFLDGLKGFVVAIIAFYLFDKATWHFYWLGLAGLFGHQFPVYLRFRGGKAISYTMGFLLYAFTWPTLFGIIVFLSLLFATRKFEVSLAIGIVTIPLLWMLIFSVPFEQILKVMFLLVFIGIKKWLDLPYEARVKKGEV